MDNLQAEFLSVKLKYYPKILEEKRKIADEYNKYFTNINTVKGVKHSYNIYTVLVNDRHSVVECIKNSVQTRVYYSVPVSSQKPYMFNNDNLNNTNLLANKQLSLPIYPGVDYAAVINTFKELVSDKLCTVL